MKKIISLFVFLSTFTTRCFSETHVDVYCLSSSNGDNIEMRTYYDNENKFDFGFVSRNKTNIRTPVYLEDYASEELDKESPNQTEYLWKEVSEGNITGEYEVISQGALIRSFVYKNYKTGKEVGFLMNFDIDYTEKNGCNWISQEAGK